MEWGMCKLASWKPRLLFLGICAGITAVMIVVQFRVPAASETTPQERYLQVTQRAVLDGHSFRAFLVAYADFVKNPHVPASKRDIVNYYIAIDTRNSEKYVVWFLPRLLPAEKNLVGGETTLGREVKYEIDKKTNKITSTEYPL